MILTHSKHILALINRPNRLLALLHRFRRNEGELEDEYVIRIVSQGSVILEHNWNEILTNAPSYTREDIEALMVFR